MGFLFFPMMTMGLRLAALRATGAPLIRQWIIKKERGIISICDSIWLGTNSIKLTPYGGELAMGLNRQNLISICDSIWLGTNSIKLTRYGGELGGGELAMGRNRQLPLGAIYPCAQQFFESVARGKLWATRDRYCPKTNIRAYFRPKWRLLSLLSFKSFSQRTQFWKLGNIFGYSPVFAGEYSPAWRV